MPSPFASRRTQLAVGLVAGLVLIAVVVVVAGGDDEDLETMRSDDATTTSAQADPSTSAAPTTSSEAPSSSTTAAPTAPTAAPAPTTRPTGTDPAIRLSRVAEVNSPSAVVDLTGDGTVLVATLSGRVLRTDLGSGQSEVVLDLSGVVSTGGERGLLGMAADPAGERLYVDYTNVDGDTEIRSWPLSDGVPAGGPEAGVEHLRIDQPYRNHNGGHLLFGPDGALWVGTGDGGSSGDPDEVAQDPGSLLGKMLRVVPEPTGGVRPAQGNPSWGGRPEVWAIGLRNPWRYSFDRQDGRLWVADVGQNTTEEVSVVSPGAERPNFGWDDMEGDRPFEGRPEPRFISPVLTYGHDDGCSITGGYVYRGEAVASLHGWYLFGDFCGGWIRAVPADDPGRAPLELVPDAGSVLSFAELRDGELLVLTRGGLHRVVAR